MSIVITEATKGFRTWKQKKTEKKQIKKNQCKKRKNLFSIFHWIELHIDFEI